jgi:hypothetical protein
VLTGAARRLRVYSLTGDGGLFEQGLVLAPGLWPVLGGIEFRPPDQ